jgi:hypothetical protein
VELVEEEEEEEQEKTGQQEQEEAEKGGRERTVKKAENHQHLPVDPDEREEIWLDSLCGRCFFCFEGSFFRGGRKTWSGCLSISLSL